MEPLDVLRIITEQLGHITKRLDEIDEKLDTYQTETTKLKSDVGWIKGSAKVGITFFLTVVGGLITAFIKIVPDMKM